MSKDEEPPEKGKMTPGGDNKKEGANNETIYMDFKTGRRITREDWEKVNAELMKTPEERADDFLDEVPASYDEMTLQNSVKINSLKHVVNKQQKVMSKYGEMGVASANLVRETAIASAANGKQIHENSKEIEKHGKEINNIWSKIMSNVSTKEFRIGIIAVIAALAITSYFLIKKVETATPVETKYVFNPDRIAQMKPRFVHLIQNQTDLDTLQNDPFVMNKNLLSIGAAIYTGSDGYGIFPQKTLNDPQQMYHVEQINSTDTINGKYPINALLTRESFPVDMIQTEGELNMVLRNSAIIDANLADIGAVVAQSPNGNYLIQKSILSEKYEALLIKE